MTDRHRPRRVLALLLPAAALAVSSVVAVVAGAPPAHAATASSTFPLTEFMSNPGGGAPWGAYDESATAVGPTVQGTPAVIGDPADGLIHAYVCGANGDLVEYVDDGANNRQWNAYDLTFGGGGATPVTGTPSAFYDPADHLIHVYTRSVYGDLVEYVDNNLGGHVWNQYDVSYGAPGGSPINGTPSAFYDPADGLIHVYAEASDGYLVEYDNGAVKGHPWDAWGLSIGASGGGMVAGTPDAFFDPQDGLIHIYIQATQGDLVEYDNGHLLGRPWNAWDLSFGASGGGVVTSTPSAFLDPSDHLIHIYVQGPTSNLMEYVNANYGGHPWNGWDISYGASGAMPMVGNPSALFDPDDGLIHVYVRTPNNLLLEYDNGNLDGHPWNGWNITAGSSGPTIGIDPAALVWNGHIHVYTGGQSFVGVYGFASWNAASSAIGDGWSIVADTGGLGTQGPPYAQQLASNPDLNIGDAIGQTQASATWLSFWTVSGPTGADSWYTAGAEGGQTAATSIDNDANTSGRKPQFVILDPEGYNIPAATADFQNFIQGFADGVRSVDGSLRPAFYSDQSQYYDYQLSSVALPAFIAVTPIIYSSGTPDRPFDPSYNLGSPGPNIMGYVEYGDFNANPPQPNCPAAVYEDAIRTWGGFINTLQFPDSGVDCAP